MRWFFQTICNEITGPPTPTSSTAATSIEAWAEPVDRVGFFFLLLVVVCWLCLFVCLFVFSFVVSWLLSAMAPSDGRRCFAAAEESKLWQWHQPRTEICFLGFFCVFFSVRFPFSLRRRRPSSFVSYLVLFVFFSSPSLERFANFCLATNHPAGSFLDSFIFAFFSLSNFALRFDIESVRFFYEFFNDFLMNFTNFKIWQRRSAGSALGGGASTKPAKFKPSCGADRGKRVKNRGNISAKLGNGWSV